MAGRAEPPPASAIVLAGGRSSRMGTPKALLLFDGRPLIAHLVAALRTRFEEVVVVASPALALPALPARVVRDDVEYQGPVGGLVYGLRAVTHDLAFVSSCDAPFLNLDLVSCFLSRAEGHDVVVGRWQGRLQPLHAVYRASVLPQLEQQLARGELRPVSLFDRVRTLVLGEDEIRLIDPEGMSFLNMNTPEDYAQALQLWQRNMGK
jgi:molybdopterin-guanine dinucleotide biosynthesis protein A